MMASGEMSRRTVAAATEPAVGAPVTADGLTIRRGTQVVWSDATFAIAAGEFVAILGPNGAGKSTLLSLLLGLLRPTAGQLTIFGQPPRRGNPTIGYVPQRRTLDLEIALRGRDLVAMGIDGHRWGFAVPGRAADQRRQRVEDAIAAVEATAYADRSIGQLSGGERQRLWLAQALVGEPSLLLLDEPLASLDLRSALAMVQLIARLARERGITVLLVAHDINPLLPVVDRVLYIARGAIAMGAPAEIITTERLSALYQTPVEVLHDQRGRVFVVGLEGETTHPHGA